MTVLDTRSTVSQFVLERPDRSRVFDRLGIDYCCGGRKPLAEACAERKIDPQAVLSAIEEDDRLAGGEGCGEDWTKATLAGLCDHVEATHHTYLKEELPRLAAMVQKVARVHGERHPEMVKVAAVFQPFVADMMQHMMKEEQILFPMIRHLESSSGPLCFHCGSVNNPIRVMVHEHDNAGHDLSQMRELTGGYVPPADACNTFRATLAALDRLEKDMHQHVHKENNILFPRAAELEASRQGASR